VGAVHSIIRVAVSRERSSIRFRNAPKAEVKQGINICLDGHSGLMASPGA
jgi:hypothetical protein